MKLYLTFLSFFLFSQCISANNLQITNLTRNGNTIDFDVTWENSWRSSLQWSDAVWIFVKQAPNGGPSWQHANIESATAGNLFGAFIPDDEVGFYLRWVVDNNGTASTSVSVTLSGLVGAFQDIKVMGVEMVYVPAGAYYAGDGYSFGRIARGDDINEPYHVSTNNAITCGSSSTDIQYASGGCTDIPYAFPKGFQDFYCMKYVITQSQYVDFLNCLSRNQQENRVNADITGTTVTNRYVMGDNTLVAKGNVIRCDENIGTGNITFYCDRNGNDIGNEEDDGMSRACNYLRTTDWMAYLDWAGLRPFTFLEAEKAARGPLAAVANEQSWGSTLWTNNGTLQNAGTASEKWSNSNIDGGISTYSDDVVRVGCNAPSSGATRELSNASYYGIIDLGNNPSDYYITKDHVTTYTEENGDGNLDTGGDANVTTWPYLDPAVGQKVKISISSYGFSQMSLGLTGPQQGGGRGVRSY